VDNAQNNRHHAGCLKHFLYCFFRLGPISSLPLITMAVPPLPGEPNNFPGRENDISDQMEEEIYQNILSSGKPFDIFLKDNTTDSYRDVDREGILFVPQEPCQIRSLEETGLVYRIRHEDEVLQIELNNPKERATDLVRISGGHPLCVPCKDALNYYSRWLELKTTVCVLHQWNIARNLSNTYTSGCSHRRTSSQCRCAPLQSGLTTSLRAERLMLHLFTLSQIVASLVPFRT
jgi:hypothetical protein